MSSEERAATLVPESSGARPLVSPCTTASLMPSLTARDVFGRPYTRCRFVSFSRKSSADERLDRSDFGKRCVSDGRELPACHADDQHGSHDDGCSQLEGGRPGERQEVEQRNQRGRQHHAAHGCEQHEATAIIPPEFEDVVCGRPALATVVAAVRFFQITHRADLDVEMWTARERITAGDRRSGSWP